MALLRHGPRSNLSTMRCRIPFPYPVCHLTPQFHAESHRLRRQGVREERQLRHGVEQPPCNACRQGVRRGNGACLERRPHHGGGRRQWLHVHKPRRCLGLGEVHVQPVIDEVDHREVQHVDLATPRAQLGVTLCRRRWQCSARSGDAASSHGVRHVLLHRRRVRLVRRGGRQRQHGGHVVLCRLGGHEVHDILHGVATVEQATQRCLPQQCA